KSDRKDAEMLARLARSDEKLLYPVTHRSARQQRDLLQIKLRDNLLRQRVDVISAVRFTLKSMGIRVGSPNTTCFARHARRGGSLNQAPILTQEEAGKFFSGRSAGGFSGQNGSLPENLARMALPR
ncbi:MAG: hypothetical protein H7A52_17905, partial [Akkermansiaceae bacterium]|nr:hypothetical protein [Akkermansiaceae bacterium]